MALSGTFTDSIGSYWKLQLEWTATQDIANNSSTITSKLYWIGTGSYSAISSSASKDWSHTVNASMTTGTASAGLSAGQKKLIQSRTVVVPHNSDGTKTVNFSGIFDIAVTLSGTYYGTASVSGSATLNTIPRASTLSSSASWTLTNDLPLTISRASSSFTHTASLYVNGILIKQVTGIGTSHTIAFTNTENKNMFTQLAQTASKATSIEIKTYSGGTLIGTTTKAGTLTAPSASTIATSTDTTRYVDESFPFTITRADAVMTHTVRFYFEGTLIKTLSGVTTGGDPAWLTAEMTTIYGKIPTAQSGTGEIQVDTFYETVKVRSTTTKAFTLTVRNSYPVFSTGQISYVDSNTTTTAITGNSSVIVQNKSTVTAYVNTSATPKNGATISRYVVSLANRTANIVTTTGNVNLGTIDASANQSLNVTAVDSRGFETTVAILVTVVPYTAPTLTPTANRTNKFEAETTLVINGTYSLVPVASITKNAVQTITYKTRVKNGSWSAPITKTPVTYTAPNKYSVTNTILTLDNTKQYDVEVAVTDKFQTTVITLVVAQGQPIMFMDSVKKSVAVGKFPVGTGTFEAVKATIDEFTGISKWTLNTDLGQIVIDPPSSYNAMIVFKKQGVQLGRVYSYYVDNGMRIEATNTLTLSGTKITLNSPTLISPIADAGATTTTHALTIGASDTTGDSLKLDANELSAFASGAPSDIHINPDGGDVALGNNASNKIRFNATDGLLYQTRYKHPNGYNHLGVRDGTGTFNDTYVIQNVLVSVQMGGTAQAFVDVSFPALFSDEPLWIVAQPVNVNSASYKTAVYSPTTSGCRVYMSQIHNGVYTGIIQAQVIACGKKVSTFA